MYFVPLCLGFIICILGLICFFGLGRIVCVVLIDLFDFVVLVVWLDVIWGLGMFACVMVLCCLFCGRVCLI